MDKREITVSVREKGMGGGIIMMDRLGRMTSCSSVIKFRMNMLQKDIEKVLETPWTICIMRTYTSPSAH